ncbi:MAG: uL22 family ribosomal protein [Candidatus Micrarchaeaceae archaeon]
MNYSFNVKGEDFVFAQSYDINASYKDLGAVCDAIRYLKAETALDILHHVVEKDIPVAYRRHNKHMGSRHELGGQKGGYPEKAASEILKTLSNAIANAGNRGKEGNEMVIVGASANKTRIERRYPSKGSIAWGRGMYGMSATNHSDIEYAKIEIVLADEFSDKLTKNMKYFIKMKKANNKQPKAEAKPTLDPKAKKLQAQKEAERKKGERKEAPQEKKDQKKAEKIEAEKAKEEPAQKE